MGKNWSWNLKCALCPWFGGALRPTNISSWDPTFIKYQTTIIEPNKIIEEVKPSKKTSSKQKQTSTNSIFKSDIKSLSLSGIMDEELKNVNRENFLLIDE